MSYSTVSISTSIDLDDTQFFGYNYIIANCNNNDVEIELPQQTWDGQTIQIIRSDSNTNYDLIISAKSGQTINGVADTTLAPNQLSEIVSYANNWICPKLTYN